MKVGQELTVACLFAQKPARMAARALAQIRAHAQADGLEPIAA